jgi:tRNA-dihydrouridine synthase B
VRTLSAIPQGSLFFAPMEGITDESFRKTILKLYPEWDVLACDFLRVPAAGKYPIKHLVRHFGRDLFEIPWVKEKTMYQILTSHRSFTEQLVKDLEFLEIPWLDLNLGCPSGTVCRSKGGSFLLTDLHSLRPLVRTIRENFKGRFTAKIRIGYHNTLQFEDSIKLLNDEGVEMITVHARTRDMMYKEPAQWDYIARAAQLSKVPIIGNGDIWKTEDINRMFEYTRCHSVMVARGALKSPWMAQDYRRGVTQETDRERIAKIKYFFAEYKTLLESENISMRGLLKQSKSVSRFMLEDIEDGAVKRRELTMTQTAPEFFEILERL